MEERIKPSKLTDEERATYQWQMWTPGYGEPGQEKLKGATALISRCGGLGSPVAQELAAAGIGKLIIAHGGNVKHSDLNRQILMTYDWLGKPRAESAVRRLKELNPRLEVEGISENINEDNAAKLVSKVDVVFDCAPLFEERFLMNRECVRQNKPLIESAMFSMEGQVTTIIPGETPCLACIYPEDPPAWKREFPVFGAVSALAANVAVMEAIKLISGMETSLAGQMLYYDMLHMSFQKIQISRKPDCPICSHLP
jgi:molybdopterin/thiamine biosynthesis adenylyltransferase